MRVALVTGGAGAIGSAITGALHTDGFRVIAADLSEERLAALASTLPGLETVVADLSSAKGVERALAATGGAVDVLCNTAGVSDGGASIEELDDAVWERVMRINLDSIYLMCNRVVPGMHTGDPRLAFPRLPV